MDITKLLAKFLGNKSERDMKDITPLVDKVQEIYHNLSSVSNDELRNMTFVLKDKIQAYVSDEENKLVEYKEKGEDPNVEVSEKEEIYSQIDKLIETIDTRNDEILLECLPEAFAIVRETARRFKENAEIEVTARDYDKDLAAHMDHILIKGDKAIWKNKWIAGERNYMGYGTL
jgi:preprotein translocase subunit SecA